MKARSDDVVWREVDGQVIILDLKTSTYLSTNATGTYLWGLLQEDKATDDLEAALVDKYGVGPDRAKQDVDAFLDMLRSNELLAG